MLVPFPVSAICAQMARLSALIEVKNGLVKLDTSTSHELAESIVSKKVNNRDWIWSTVYCVHF